MLLSNISLLMIFKSMKKVKMMWTFDNDIIQTRASQSGPFQSLKSNPHPIESILLATKFGKTVSMDLKV